MILFTNGCSWTWGGALEPHFKTQEERLKLVWPHYLGQMLNASKVVNLAAGCGSNQRIVRTTFDWVLQEYKTDEPVLAIIQLTETARYEYYTTDDIDDFTNDEEHWAKVTPSASYAPYEKNIANSYLRTMRYRTFTTIEGMYKMISDCNALAKLFESYNIKYYMWPGASRIPDTYPSLYKNYLINKCNVLNMDNAWEYERYSQSDLHPGLLGHKQIAEILYNNITL